MEQQFQLEELESVRKLCNGSSILEITLLPQQVVVQISITAAKTFTVYIYPQNPLFVELKSRTLDTTLLTKITSIMNKQNYNTIPAILTYLYKVTKDNMLLPCWTEVAKFHDMKGVEDLKLKEKEGTIKLHLREKDYFVALECQIPNDYPHKSPTVRITSSNFTQSLVQMFEGQLAAMLARIKAYQPESREEKIQRKPTVHELHDIRHDLKFLKQASDLTELSDSKVFRRQKTRMIKAEVEFQKQKNQGTSSQVSSVNDAQVDHFSVFELVQFLYEQFVYTVPNAMCKQCSNPIVPTNPNDQETRMPQRLICTHWYHYNCLHDYLTSPPFTGTKPCHTCNARITHREWNREYILRAEKQYALQQAKERELKEIEEFFQ